MHKKSILVIEDSKGLAYVLEKFLEEIGYKSHCTHSGVEGIKIALNENICLAIIDVGLPDISGLKVIEKIKDVKENLAIIVISEPKDIDNEIAIYEKGVSLFHRKPLSFKLLETQIRNLAPECKKTIMEINDLKIDLQKGIVRRNNSDIMLTKMEKMCLEYLIDAEGDSCSRKNILKHLTFDYLDKTDHCVDTLICRLRRKLGHNEERKIIETVNGVGYRILTDREI